MRVVVVGSGVAGAGAAYELARNGAEPVMVDAGFAGRATEAGAGIVCPWASRQTDPHWHRLANAGAAAFPSLLDALAEDTGVGAGKDAGRDSAGYRRVGALRLLDADTAASVHAQVVQRAAGSPQAGSVSLLDGAQARDMFPPLQHDGPALHLTGAARVDGRRLARALRGAAARRGARMVRGHAQLATRGRRVTGVSVDGDLLAADAVVDAAGAWSRQLWQPLALRNPVRPQRGQIVHLRMPDPDTSNWPVVFPRSAHYLLAFGQGRVVVGATREDSTGFDYRATAAGVWEVLHEAHTVAPGLRLAEHLATRVGFRPVGPDTRPLLGPVSPYAGLHVVNGLGASGLTMGPYAGALVARHVLGVEPGIDLAPYDPLRSLPAPADTGPCRGTPPAAPGVAHG